MKKETIKQAIIVEGKYDKIAVLSVVDAIVIQTNGFRIFKDESKKNYIKKLASECGIIILTDSDSAGFLIRNHLKSFVPENMIANAYVKPKEGTEKRKDKSSKEGLLGVEGMGAKEILNALKNCVQSQELRGDRILLSVADLYTLGLTGKENSSEKKQALLKKLALPSYLSNKELLRYLNFNTNYNFCDLEELLK